MWNLEYDTNQHIYETKQTHRYREQTWLQGAMAGGGVERRNGSLQE